MRRPLVLAAAAGTLALAGGTAIAATGAGPLGPVFGGDGKDRQEELSRELAERLPGVNQGQVERALEDLRRDQHAERRAAEAKALAAELDGVSAEDVEKALEKVEQQFERARSRGEWRRADVVGTLAKELGKSESEVRKAFQAAHRKQFERKLDEAVKDGRITKEQADRIKERFENGPPEFGGGHRGFGPGPGGPGPGGPGGFGPGHGGPPPSFR